MRRHLLATAAAITTTVVIAFVTPAFAQVQEEPTEIEGNPVLCEDLVVDDLELVFLEGVEDGLPTVVEDLSDFFDPALPIVAVVVQGEESANVYIEPPFVNLVAPDEGEIIFIDVCGLPEEPTPTPTETPAEEPKTPAPVPTNVPAGGNDDDSGPAWPFGLVLAASAAVAGAAMAARRRFLHDS
jgi:hypothetical protein